MSETHFLRERYLLAELETEVVDGQLNTDGLLVRELQWYSESNCHDKPFKTALESDLMDTPLLCQVVS